MVADAEGLTAAKDLVERAKERRGQQANRLGAYERYLSAYFQTSSGESFGAAAINNYADGRPALRAQGENVYAKTRASPNYIKPIVDDLVAVRGA